MKKVGIIMGSDSDLPKVEKAMTTLDELRVPYEVHVFSAHRTPVEASGFAKNAAFLAAQIIAVSDGELAERLASQREEGKANVLKKNAAVEEKYNHKTGRE